VAIVDLGGATVQTLGRTFGKMKKWAAEKCMDPYSEKCWD